MWTLDATWRTYQEWKIIWTGCERIKKHFAVSVTWWLMEWIKVVREQCWVISFHDMSQSNWNYLVVPIFSLRNMWLYCVIWYQKHGNILTGLSNVKDKFFFTRWAKFIFLMWLPFILASYPSERHASICFSPSYRKIAWHTRFFSLH